jgi:hypothetical protein
MIKESERLFCKSLIGCSFTVTNKSKLMLGFTRKIIKIEENVEATVIYDRYLHECVDAGYQMPLTHFLYELEKGYIILSDYVNEKAEEEEII